MNFLKKITTTSHCTYILINLNLIEEGAHFSINHLIKRDVILQFLRKNPELNTFRNNEEFLLKYTFGFIDAGFWLEGLSDSNERLTSMKYLMYYYFSISGCLNFEKRIQKHSFDAPALKYFLILRNNQDKMKYTLTNFEGRTYVTMSIGVILKYFETYKKSLKKSIKAHTLMLRFIRNTITKMVKQDGYVFIVRGVSLRLFRLINFFNFCQKISKMFLYVLQPKQIFKKTIGKKVKSIKRKLQKKNLVKVNLNYQISKKLNKTGFAI